MMTMNLFKRNWRARPVLGVTVGDHTVRAVLVEIDAESKKPTVLDVLMRSRTGQEQDAMQPMGALGAGMHAGYEGAMLGDAAPAFASGDGATADVDFNGTFTLQYGNTVSAGSDLFLEGEFGALDLRPQASAVPNVPSAPSAPDHQGAIESMLQVCHQRGYHDVDVVIGRWPDESTYVELVAPSPAGRKAGSTPQRKHLLALLREHAAGSVSPERVVFLPMTPTASGDARYLAVIAHVERPSLEQESKRGQHAPTWLVDAEMNLYRTAARLVRERYPQAGSAEPQTTCIVRAGHESTLVIFFIDGELAHVDVHPSLSAFDAPDRIYRRVLFEQDKHHIDHIDVIGVLAEANERAITSAFTEFFPEGTAIAIRDLFPTLSFDLPEDGQVAEVIALGAALRSLGPADRVGGARPRTTRTSRSFSRLLPAILVFFGVLATAGGFAYTSMQMEREIEARREQLAMPQSVDPSAMTKAYVDSLQAAYVAYTRASDRYDSLLVGSDGWSRVLENIANESAAVRGVWIESWRQTGEEIKLVGNATSRDRVVALADRLGATIETLSFSEIREWPVYAFTLRLPFERELPDVAIQLREQAETLARAQHAQAAE